MPSKETIVASIEAAKADLEQALADLQRLPALDPETVRHAAHTLGNYVNVTSACVELLTMALKDHPEQDVHSWLRGLDRVSDLMAHVVRQLTHTMAARDVHLVREQMSMALLAQRGCTFYQHVAERKGIQIICEIDTQTPHVWTDRIAAAVVLDNLLSNAVKYSVPGKRVWVRVWSEADHVVCTVRDEGAGLSVEDQAKLFQRGVRLGSTPTAGEPSSGYGLAIAKELIDKLGGRLWCDSVVGQGASFSFRLPRHAEGHPEPLPPAAPAPQSGQ
jgi:signal transduction histidine kinase